MFRLRGTRLLFSGRLEGVKYYICMYIYMYVCMCVCVCIYIYIYIYILPGGNVWICHELVFFFCRGCKTLECVEKTCIKMAEALRMRGNEKMKVRV